MSAALTDKDASDLCATHRTFLIGAPIHAKLELAAAIHPIKGCAIASNTFIQHCMDRFVQSPGLPGRDRVRDTQWMELRNVQRLVCIDIAEPGKKGLVQEQGLNLA